MAELHNNKIQKQVQTYLQKGKLSKAVDLIKSLLPADQVHIVSQLPFDEQVSLLKSIEVEQAANILEVLNDSDAANLAEELELKQLVEILDEMEPDEAADLLGDLEPDLRRQSLSQLSKPGEIRSLLKYPDDSAGGLMTLEYFAYPEDTPIGDVFLDIQNRPLLDKEIPYVYALDGDGRPTGVTRTADLIRAHPQQPLDSITIPRIISISPDEDQEIAAQMLNQYDLLGLPVVDQEGKLLGVITVDDAINALESEATEDILQGAGIITGSEQQSMKSEQLVRGSIWHSMAVRIPFLFLTMIGGILAGSVIGVFEEALETVVILAFFIPVVMNMGGNSGSQSTSIFIRGYALGQIDLPKFYQHLLRELFIGLGMGLIVGIIAGSIAALWQGDFRIGLVVGLSIISTITLATGLGFLVPLLLDKIGIDPAVASEPIITTIKDITGMLIYFSFATLFISQI